MYSHINIIGNFVLSSVALFILIGCATEPNYQVNTQPQKESEKFKMGIVNWPADRNDPLEEVSQKLKKCLKKHISKLCQNTEVIGHQTVRDAVYPFMEPSTQPRSTVKFTDLLAQSNISSRLNSLGINILVTFSGNTDVMQLYSDIQLTHVGIYGIALLYENTNIVINIWQINDLSNLTSLKTNEDGYSLIIGIGLPIPFYAKTLESGCAKTSELIKNHINSNKHNFPCQ